MAPVFLIFFWWLNLSPVLEVIFGLLKTFWIVISEFFDWKFFKYGFCK
jgi:hypothetical protein